MGNLGSPCGWGNQTPYHYQDGTPVLVGDRLAIPGETAPGTMRIRYNSMGGGSLYITYNKNDHTYTCPIPAAMPNGYMERYVYKDARPVRKAKPRILPAGDYITSPFDYDNVIILRVR